MIMVFLLITIGSWLVLVSLFGVSCPQEEVFQKKSFGLFFIKKRRKAPGFSPGI